MLHMVISSHTAESCPGRAGNEAILPCLYKMDELMAGKGIKIVGRWADPPGHVNYLVLDADGHAITGLFMESWLSAYTTNEIRPVLSMD